MYVIFQTCLFLVLLQCARGISHKSSILEDGHPILRTGPDMDDIVESIPEMQAPRPPDDDQPIDGSWLHNLRANIRNLVAEYGPEDAKPLVKNLVDETEKLHGVLLRVRVKRNGKTKIKYLNFRRAGNDNRFKIATPKPVVEPDWMVKLKAYATQLMNEKSFGEMDDEIAPLIQSIQRKENIVITKFDLDRDGKVVVEYETKKKPSRWIDRKGAEYLRSKPEEKSPLQKGVDALVNLFSDTSFRAFMEGPRPKKEPYWLANFKGFVSQMIDKYGRAGLTQRLKPQMQSRLLVCAGPKDYYHLRDNYKMDIATMDVDDIGPILYTIAKQRGQLYRGPRRSLNNTLPSTPQPTVMDSMLRTKTGNKNKKEKTGQDLTNERWLPGYKDYVKVLVSMFGEEAIVKHLNPVTKEMEKKHGVRISDVDVNSLGDVFVKFKKKSKRTREKNKENKKKNEGEEKGITKNGNIRRSRLRYRGLQPILRQAPEEEPEWVRGFKLYILYCFRKYGKTDMHPYVSYAQIKLEKKYNVEICCIDVQTELDLVTFNYEKKKNMFISRNGREEPLTDLKIGKNTEVVVILI